MWSVRHLLTPSLISCRSVGERHRDSCGYSRLWGYFCRLCDDENPPFLGTLVRYIAHAVKLKCQHTPIYRSITETIVKLPNLRVQKWEKQLHAIMSWIVYFDWKKLPRLFFLRMLRLFKHFQTVESSFPISVSFAINFVCVCFSILVRCLSQSPLSQQTPSHMMIFTAGFPPPLSFFHCVCVCVCVVWRVRASDVLRQV